jgi:hypothetical protein
MDSSVPWDLFSVNSCKIEVTYTRKRQGSQLQKLKDGMFNECSRLEPELVTTPILYEVLQSQTHEHA